MAILTTEKPNGKGTVHQDTGKPANSPASFRLVPALLLPLLLAGCMSLMTGRLVAPMTQALESQTDLALVREGTPSLLLTLEGLLADAPDDLTLLTAAVRASGSFASLLHELGEDDRAQPAAERGRRQALTLLARLLGVAEPAVCPLPELEAGLVRLAPADAETLFWAGNAWGNWVRLQQFSPAALAELPRVEAIMTRVLILDETVYYGAAHIFLGYLQGMRPALIGGNPAKSREHFERALAVNGRQFLLTQVYYAESYARQTLDRELFVQLLQEVLTSPASDPRMATANALAKKKAGDLLARTDTYF